MSAFQAKNSALKFIPQKRSPRRKLAYQLMKGGLDRASKAELSNVNAWPSKET